MKNLKAPFLVIALLFLNVLLAAPKNLPPPGNVQSTSNAGEMTIEDEPCFGCPEQFPIDENIVFLLTSGLILGVVVIYKKNQTKKASI
ncbi:hypothetical protein [Flavobacterium sp. DG2-3]|uniref:hypothetical protein n=1 Tax=Flavobacterium sp. DG2-3 TaxID=3068317 RepID=UPI00273EF24A|nr:hypothetical protein [Flavobacterium sp. DG2-3]MDP5198075.1 hypothetical protein [Flavobacterium sp. DG2-3]